MSTPLAAEEAVKISDMACKQQPESYIIKARDLLLKAQLLMEEIEAMHLDINRPLQPHKIQQEHQASIEDNRETLVIEGFRFKSAASREDLRKLSPQAGAGGCQDDT